MGAIAGRASGGRRAGAADPWEYDTNGHMNVEFYIARFAGDILAPRSAITRGTEGGFDSRHELVDAANGELSALAGTRCGRASRTASATR